MKYFSSDGEYIYLDAEYAEAYVPKDLFAKTDVNISESAVAYEYGNAFRLVGIFHMRFYNSDTADRDSAPLKTFCYPSTIETHPSSSSDIKLSLKGEEPTMYRVFQYYREDVIMSATVAKSVRHCEQFMHLLSSGHIPNSLKYDDIFFTWIRNFDINSIGPEVPGVVLQGFISEMCRDPSNPNTQYRKVIGKNPKANPYGYIALGMNGMSAYSSTMSALSFERFSEKLTTSLIMQKENIKQPISPIEKVLVM